MPAPPPRRSRPPKREFDDLVIPEPEVWIDEGLAGERPTSNPRPTKKRSSATTKVKVDLPQLVELVGQKRAERLQVRLGEAAEAFSGERFGEAKATLAPIAREVPDLPEARELYGLTLYRLGRWKEAARELEAFVELSGSTEQHPVLADCRRALKQYREVERLWEELREASPNGELMAEGRIVAAGALADQGDLASAIRLLAKGFRLPKHPAEHHLRRAYALADLYERAGDMPQARSLFERLDRAEPGFLDVRSRLDNLA